MRFFQNFANSQNLHNFIQGPGKVQERSQEVFKKVQPIFKDCFRKVLEWSQEWSQNGPGMVPEWSWNEILQAAAA